MIIQVMAVMGGSMIPVLSFPPLMQTVGKVTINYWAITGFRDLMLGKDIAAVVPSIVALLAFAVVFMVLGVWRFRYE